MANHKPISRRAGDKLYEAERRAAAIRREAEIKAQEALNAAQEEAEKQHDASASGILEEASRIVAGARNTTHGDKERSFQAIADFWNVYLSNRKGNEVYAGISAENVAQMFELSKVVRSIQGSPVRDHFVDAAGYAGITGELYETRKARAMEMGLSMQAIDPDSNGRGPA